MIERDLTDNIRNNNTAWDGQIHFTIGLILQAACYSRSGEILPESSTEPKSMTWGDIVIQSSQDFAVKWPFKMSDLEFLVQVRFEKGHMWVFHQYSL